MLGTSLVGGMVLGGQRTSRNRSLLNSAASATLCAVSQYSVTKNFTRRSRRSLFLSLRLNCNLRHLYNLYKHPLTIPFGDLYFQGHILFLLATSMSTRGSKTLHAVAGHIGERVREDRDSSLEQMAGTEILLNAGSLLIIYSPICACLTQMLLR